MNLSNSSDHGSRARSSKSTSNSDLHHHIALHNMKIIFLSIILHYSKHFQFNPKISIKEIKWLNISKVTRNIPNFNTEYNTLYMYSTKNRESNFFFHNFAVCQMIAVCNRLGTRQTSLFCRVLGLCRVLYLAAHGKRTPLPCVGTLPCGFGPDTRQKKYLPCAN